MPEDEAETMSELRIRMYNVGFGDCFLLFIPTDAGERTMLLDCGKHMSSKTGHTVSEAARDIVETVKGADGTPCIDVVVATHRHYDHISGFDLKLWEKVEVGEVWMPWTEEPGNPAADKIRRSQNRLAKALCRRFGADSAVGLLAFNSLSNDGAMAQLRSFPGQRPPRYLPEQAGGVQTFTTDTLPGVRIHALGPSHDPDVIALMDPPAGKYFPDEPDATRDELIAMGGAAAAPAAAAVPFRDLFTRDFRWETKDFAKKYPELAKDADTQSLEERAQFDMFAAATSLEDAINGTSLVFALDFGHVCVLLAGDAEWGTWSAILDDPVARAVLSRTCAYKVSHHGSFNGTPSPFVDELLPNDATSMVSLGKMDIWPSIPRKSLLSALEDAQRRLLRSDQLPLPGDDLRHHDDLWVELSVSVG
jgi:beta-lactamase superfamily II metal-dependent hydrolase